MRVAIPVAVVATVDAVDVYSCAVGFVVLANSCKDSFYWIYRRLQTVIEWKAIAVNHNTGSQFKRKIRKYLQGYQKLYSERLRSACAKCLFSNTGPDVFKLDFMSAFVPDRPCKQQSIWQMHHGAKWQIFNEPQKFVHHYSSMELKHIWDL